MPHELFQLTEKDSLDDSDLLHLQTDVDGTFRDRKVTVVNAFAELQPKRSELEKYGLQATAMHFSTATPNIADVDGDFIKVIDAGTITTGFTLGTASAVRTLYYASTGQMTNSANLILPGGVNLIISAGDTLVFRSLGAGPKWLCVAHMRPDAYFFQTQNNLSEISDAISARIYLDAQQYSAALDIYGGITPSANTQLLLAENGAAGPVILRNTNGDVYLDPSTGQVRITDAGSGFGSLLADTVSAQTLSGDISMCVASAASSVYNVFNNSSLFFNSDGVAVLAEAANQTINNFFGSFGGGTRWAFDIGSLGEMYFDSFNILSSGSGDLYVQTLRTGGGSGFILQADGSGSNFTGSFGWDAAGEMTATSAFIDSLSNNTNPYIAFGAPTTFPGYTVAALPVASTMPFARCFATDALAPAFGSPVVGGGAVTVPVYSDGTTFNVG